MLATILTLAFIVTAAMSVAVIAASLAKGVAAVAMLRRQLALAADQRLVIIRHERAARARPVTQVRAPRRSIRPGPGLATRRLAAA
jgi:hypothetical protein